jgi:hypothetical protein
MSELTEFEPAEILRVLWAMLARQLRAARPE